MRVEYAEFDGKPCVLKNYNLGDQSARSHQSARRQLIRSVRLMREVAHANVATVEAVFVHQKKRTGKATAYVQLPLYTGGALSLWLRREENRAPLLQGSKPGVIDRASERGALCHVRALHQVLTALAHVHAKGPTHTR